MIEFWSYNLVDKANISADSVNAQFPLSNLNDSRTTKVYRSTSYQAAIVFDLKTIDAVDSILLSPHSNLGWGFIPPITIEANATNEWGSPAFSATLDSSEVDFKHGIARKEFTEQNYRFWRLSCTGSQYVELAHVFLGKKLLIEDTTKNRTRSIDFGWTHIDEDRSVVEENRYGQRFFDVLPPLRRFTATMNLLTKEDMDKIYEMFDYNGIHNPLYVKIGCPSIVNEVNRFAGFVHFDESPTITNTTFNRYSLQLNMSEAR